jgi:hypothetical protein
MFRRNFSNHLQDYARFEVLTAVKMSMLFWVVTLGGHVGRYQRFEETYCLHLQLCRWRLCYSETSLCTCKSTQHHNPEEQH